MTFVCTCLTSRQVRTADCYLIVTARRRLSRNLFLSSSVCMSDLAWRRQNKRIDQLEASGAIASTNRKSRANKRRTNQKRRAKRRTNQKRRTNKRRTNQKHRAKRRTNQKRRANKCIDQSEASGAIASTNRKRRANKRIDQSGALGEQAPRPIRRVGSDRLDQSGASGEQLPRPIRRVSPSENHGSTNQTSSGREHW